MSNKNIVARHPWQRHLFHQLLRGTPHMINNGSMSLSQRKQFYKNLFWHVLFFPIARAFHCHFNFAFLREMQKQINSTWYNKYSKEKNSQFLKILSSSVSEIKSSQSWNILKQIILVLLIKTYPLGSKNSHINYGCFRNLLDKAPINCSC